MAIAEREMLPEILRIKRGVPGSLVGVPLFREAVVTVRQADISHRGVCLHPRRHVVLGGG